MKSALHAWLQRVWYAEAPSGVLLRPFSWVYGLLVRVRHALYRKGWLRTIDLGRPVVVVGNLSIGGTGKTPLTLWLATQLQSLGLRPGIVLRGYGGSARSARLVSPDSAVEEVGDEALLLARRSRCPVAIGRDRVAAGRQLLTRDVDLVIADDGLQHLRLRRGVEIVVIDGERRFGNHRLLPAGPLREPLTRLADVDLLVVNGERVQEGEIVMGLEADIAVSVVGRSRRALEHFAPGPVHALAAIGNPRRFFRMLEGHGLRVIPHALPDHHALTRGDLEFGDALPVLMTEKDAVKCERFADQRHWFVPVEAVLGEEERRAVLDLVVGRSGVGPSR
jgi:tetraacyldisaccharide 4'-kinase